VIYMHLSKLLTQWIERVRYAEPGKAKDIYRRRAMHMKLHATDCDWELRDGDPIRRPWDQDDMIRFKDPMRISVEPQFTSSMT
jgi:hypothetical protein